MQVRALDPDDTDAAAWFAAFHDGCVTGRDQPTVADAESTLTSLRTTASNPSTHRVAYGAWSGPRCLGGVIVNLPRSGDTHVAEFELAVAPAHRHRGAGTALFEAARTVAREHGRRLVTAEIAVPLAGSLAGTEGGRFALARGFRSVLTERRYLLDLPAVPRPVTVPDGYHLTTWTGPVTPELAGAFAGMRTLMERDVPAGDRDHVPSVVTAEQVRHGDGRLAAAGWGIVTTLLHGPDGEPAGYTRIFVNADGRHAQQDDTFVGRAHRGRRLGAVLKSANVGCLERRFPGVRHLHSWTADDNPAMIATNRRFGFRPVETVHFVEGPTEPGSSRPSRPDISGP